MSKVKYESSGLQINPLAAVTGAATHAIYLSIFFTFSNIIMFCFSSFENIF